MNNQAIQTELNALMNNKVIREFVEGEALRKVADEINAKIGGSTTAKGVAVLIQSKRNADILKRVKEYEAAGYMGVMMAKFAA